MAYRTFNLNTNTANNVWGDAGETLVLVTPLHYLWYSRFRCVSGFGMRIRIRIRFRISDYFFRPKKVFVLLTPHIIMRFFLNGQIIAKGNESICSVPGIYGSGVRKEKKLGSIRIRNNNWRSKKNWVSLMQREMNKSEACRPVRLINPTAYRIEGGMGPRHSKKPLSGGIKTCLDSPWNTIPGPTLHTRIGLNTWKNVDSDK